MLHRNFSVCLEDKTADLVEISCQTENPLQIIDLKVKAMDYTRDKITVLIEFKMQDVFPSKLANLISKLVVICFNMGFAFSWVIFSCILNSLKVH